MELLETCQGLRVSSGSLNQTGKQPKSDQRFPLQPHTSPRSEEELRLLKCFLLQLRLGSLEEMRTAPKGVGTSAVSCQDSQRAEADHRGRNGKGKDTLTPKPPQTLFPIWFARLMLLPHGFIASHLSKKKNPLMFFRSFLQRFYHIPGDI